MDQAVGHHPIKKSAAQHHLKMVSAICDNLKMDVVVVMGKYQTADSGACGCVPLALQT